MLKTAATGILILAAAVVLAWLGGWSPLNLIMGPQYSSQATISGNSRNQLVKEMVPQLYLQLVRCLEQGPETIRWIAQSGEPQQERLYIQDNGTITIDTEVFVGSSPQSASTSMEKVSVSMLDVNVDGKMDEIVYSQASDQIIHHSRPPFDQASQFLWDSGLAMAFRQSSCFE